MDKKASPVNRLLSLSRTKKAASMPLQLIVAAIIVLVVLGIILFITQRQLGESSKSYTKIGEEAEKGALDVIEKIKIGEDASKTDSEETT